MLTYTPANRILYGPIRNLLSILCILIEVLLRAHPKMGRGSLNNLKFGTFIGRFLSNDATSMAVKGLNTFWPVSQADDDDELMLNVLICHLTY